MKTLIILVPLACFACSKPSKSSPPVDSIAIAKPKIDLPNLYVNITHGYHQNAKGVMERKDSVTVYTKDYFEISLPIMANLKTYRAQKDKIISKTPFDMIITEVCDEKGTGLTFDEPVDFLNFMSERGYEMVSQTKAKYHTDYTFKRKNQ